jgi:anti-sigma regulatory factor (Ser/Thr protein kinase)
MEHGNRNDPARKVYITLKKEGSRAFIKVRDEGPGFDYRELREREQEEEDLLSVRGRGLRIVQYYAESIIFNREGNEVTLVLLLK